MCQLSIPVPDAGRAPEPPYDLAGIDRSGDRDTVERSLVRNGYGALGADDDASSVPGEPIVAAATVIDAAQGN